MDSFFGIGLFELVMIAVVALLVLGPERLPAAMREVAKWMRQLRNLSSEFQSQFSEEFKMLDDLDPRRIINEAIDPKTPTKSSPAPGAKQNAPSQPAKPLAAKPVTPPAAKPQSTAAPAAAAVAVTNGEPQNSILPPKAKQETEGTAATGSVAASPPTPQAVDLPAEAPAAAPAEVAPAEVAPADEQKPEAAQ